MDTVVSKFGGSSVADAAQIRKVAEIVASDPQRRLVVVSAPGKRSKVDEKITDTLIACHALAAEEKDFRSRFAVIRDRYNEIAAELGVGSDLAPVLDEVEESIAGGATRDEVVSRGEYLGAHMIARFLGFEFADAADLIRFADSTTVDDDATDQLCQEKLAHGRFVIPGFYGAHVDGKIQLFTRGGSDITGSLVARAVGAVRYENWTDVSGLLSADPRVVDGPGPITEVSYHELRELAYLGAAVFHDEAVAPVASADIPINIRNTNDPGHPGTMILSRERQTNRRPGERTGVAGKTGFSGIVLRRSMLNKIANLPGKLANRLAEDRVPLQHLALGADSILMIVPSDALEKAGSVALSDLKELVPGAELEQVGPYALVGAAGDDLAIRPAVLGSVMNVLSENQIAVHFVCSGYSESSFIVAVDEDRYEDVVRAVYTATE